MTVPVTDAFGARSDPAMPSLRLALDPAEVEPQLGRLPRLVGRDRRVRLGAIRVVRHKPGRRCVIEYDVEVERPGLPPRARTLMAKLRGGRSGKTAYRLLKALRRKGFGWASPDGIEVPRPIGVIPRFGMWLQLKVRGRLATDRLTHRGAEPLVQRIAEAAHKLHRAGVPADRRHTVADELRILRACLGTVARSEPRWAGRIGTLLEAAERLAEAIPETAPCGVHRDFYPDQVIVRRGPRLFLVDFDLYCWGDPALDIGNFLGHVTEYSLRTLGDPGGLMDLERAMEERFVELSGETLRPAIRAYASLTLLRHVYLSTLFPDRRAFTGSLLDLCEERINAGVIR